MCVCACGHVVLCKVNQTQNVCLVQGRFLNVHYENRGGFASVYSKMMLHLHVHVHTVHGMLSFSFCVSLLQVSLLSWSPEDKLLATLSFDRELKVIFL